MVEATVALDIGAEIKGRVRHLGIYGALIDIGTGQDALLHISQLTATEENGLKDAVQPGAEVTAYVYRMRGDGHVALTLEKPPAVPWQTIRRGNTYKGEVIRVEDFGVFVDFGAERPGMVHVSEMSDGYVKSPKDVASVGQEVDVRVIKKNGRPRQIDLSMKSADEETEIVDDGNEEELPTSMAQAFRRAMASEETAEERETARRSSAEAYRQQQEEILSRTLRGAQ